MDIELLQNWENKRMFAITNKLIFNDRNKAIKMIGAVQDICVQKKNELDLTDASEKAEECEKKFRELCKKSGDAILRGFLLFKPDSHIIMSIIA